MCKNISWKISWTSGEGDGFGNSDAPGQGEGGWFENPRFWQTSFVDGPKAPSHLLHALENIHL